MVNISSSRRNQPHLASIAWVQPQKAGQCAELQEVRQPPMGSQVLCWQQAPEQVNLPPALVPPPYPAVLFKDIFSPLSFILLVTPETLAPESCRAPGGDGRPLHWQVMWPTSGMEGPGCGMDVRRIARGAQRGNKKPPMDGNVGSSFIFAVNDLWLPAVVPRPLPPSAGRWRRAAAVRPHAGRQRPWASGRPWRGCLGLPQSESGRNSSSLRQARRQQPTASSPRRKPRRRPRARAPCWERGARGRNGRGCPVTGGACGAGGSIFSLSGHRVWYQQRLLRKVF